MHLRFGASAPTARDCRGSGSALTFGLCRQASSRTRRKFTYRTLCAMQSGALLLYKIPETGRLTIVAETTTARRQIATTTNVRISVASARDVGANMFLGCMASNFIQMCSACKVVDM